MKHLTKQEQSKIIFKQWTNANFAIFNTIGKQIKIAVLLPAYLLISFTGQAQIDSTVSVEQIEILSVRTQTDILNTARTVHIISGDEIKNLPITNIPDILEQFAGIDVRQRGAQGIQADISMKGGSFEQVLILINGVKLNDSQTGHHNMNLPVSLENIERIEILEGAGSRLFGINAYSGAVNIITKTDQNNKLKMHAFAGEHAHYGTALAANFKLAGIRNHLSGKYTSSRGYLDTATINNTDFTTFNIFWQSDYQKHDKKIDLQAGYTDKAFGANAFYSPKFPWQYEQTRTSYAAVNASAGRKNRIFLTGYFRQNQDRFELFREDKYRRNGSYFINGTDTAKYYPDIYADWNYYHGHNYHLTKTYGSELKTILNTKIGRSVLDVEYRYEDILSNVLGENSDTIPVPNEDYGEFTKAKTRSNINLCAEQLYQIKRLTFSAGITANYSPDFNWNISGGADISFRFKSNNSFFCAVNQAVRLPTFTDLYYTGATNIGNPDLKPEEALNYETGLKYHTKNTTVQISVFKRKGKNTIDWVRKSDAEKWQSMNLTELTTQGAEFSLNHHFAPKSVFKNINFAYGYINSDKESGEYFSNYALDYLKHKIVFSISHKIAGKLSASWQVRYENRNGTYTKYIDNNYVEYDYEPFYIINAKLFWRNNWLELYSEATNITNANYREAGGLQAPGSWFHTGIKLNLNNL